MQLTITDESRDLLESLFQSGAFADGTAVVEEALRLLKCRWELEQELEFRHQAN